MFEGKNYKYSTFMDLKDLLYGNIIISLLSKLIKGLTAGQCKKPGCRAGIKCALQTTVFLSIYIQITEC